MAGNDRIHHGPGADGFVRSALERHERELVAYAGRITGDLERARDVVQDTFLELVEAPRDAVEPQLAAWLFTVCRHRALDARRKEGRMRPTTDTTTDGGAHAPSAPTAGKKGPGAGATRDGEPSARLEAEDTTARILRELGRLPEREREVLRLKLHNGFAYREIAEITGLSVANVGFLIHSGLKTLRSRLQPLRRMEVGS